ncbi:hypothetical protein PMKS-000458 [Pichia membranifaciens]|uniref:Uncharacterized protein n=1 Tax=Pichia membranifaciens TaxID=4926 RepID=A0A1Q2YBS1_9ASCO|nr:hypothetical protein PMKS-000458 [Pichia membranifaciens]
MSKDNTSSMMDIDGSSFITLSKIYSDGTLDNKAKMEFNKLIDSLSPNEMLKKALSSANNRSYLGSKSAHTRRGLPAALPG